MRLRKLELRRFGRFSDAVLDFAGITDDASGVHVVYGPNEAGKSTSLDAMRYTLYGMPKGSSSDPAYDFVHAKKDIRTALELELDDGSRLAFARNRARDLSVLDAVTGEPDRARADQLERALSGVPKELWVTRHGLSQDALRTGARALLDGASTSEALFAAATGMVGAYAVLDDIRSQRQDYLKDSGRGGWISDALSELKAAATEFQRARRETSAYDELATQLRDVRRDTDAARAVHAAASSRVSVLQRAAGARALLVRRDELLAERDAVPVELAHWDAGTFERFTSAREQIERTAGPLAVAEARLVDVRQQLADLHVEPVIAAAAAAVDELHQQLAAVSSARELIATTPQASDAFDERALIELQQRLEQLEAAMSAARAIDEGALDRDSAQLDTDRRELDLQAARIDPSITDATMAAGLALPHPATRDRLSAELAASLEEQVAMARRVDEASDELERAREALDALRARGTDTPDRTGLDTLRTLRDTAWKQMRSDLGAAPDVLAARVEDVSSAALRTDLYTDRLLDDAEHVSAIAAAAAGIERAESHLDGLERAGSELLEAHAVIAERWRELWEPSGLAVADPAAMGARCAAIESVVERRQQLEQRASALTARLAQLDRARGTLARLVDAADDWGIDATLDLAGKRREELRAAAEAHVQQRAQHQAVAAARATLTSFEEAVERVRSQLVPHLDEPLDAPDPVTTTIALRELVRGAEADARAAEQLEERIRESVDILDGLRAEHAGAAAVLDELVQAAGCADVPALIAHAGSWQRRFELDARIREIDSEVLERAKMTSVELTAELEGANEAALAQRLADATDAEASAAAELERLDAMRSDLDQRIGAIRRDGAQSAARIRLQDARAELDRLIPEYRQLVLQERLLQSMLEEVAQRQRGPLLERTSSYIRQLTGGEWSRLVTGIDDAGTSQAQLERPDGSAVAITDLSEGTRDQLYLALRLAVLVDGAARGERMPFVADDILMTFDDRRAAAALELLAEVSAEFQVIFLTHHEHLVELATNVLDPSVLRIHRLDEVAGVVAT
jgi:uncharacterized protein YhaN